MINGNAPRPSPRPAATRDPPRRCASADGSAAREREKDVPRWGKSVRVGFANPQSRIPPLLGGEGWGEGEAGDPTAERVLIVASVGGGPEGSNGFEPFTNCFKPAAFLEVVDPIEGERFFTLGGCCLRMLFVRAISGEPRLPPAGRRARRRGGFRNGSARRPGQSFCL